MSQKFLPFTGWLVTWVIIVPMLGLKPSPSGDFMFIMSCTDHYRRTSHTRFDIKLHFVWIAKYRKPLLTGTIATRVRDLVRQVCTEFEVEILKGHVSKDHVHFFVSCPPHVPPNCLMQRVKGRSSRKLIAEFAEIRKACWGRHVWGRGFFVASSGNVTDEVVREYIEKQDVLKPGDNFKVDNGQ